MQCERLHLSILYHICLNFFCLIDDRLTDRRNKEIISVLKWKITCRDQKWEHAPVDQVGTISLGRIFVGNICPATQYLLAGSRLLSCRTIARFYGKNGRSYTKVVMVYIREGLFTVCTISRSSGTACPAHSPASSAFCAFWISLARPTYSGSLRESVNSANPRGLER